MMSVLEHLLHFQHFQQFISARLAQANSDSAVVYRDLFDQEMQALYDGEGWGTLRNKQQAMSPVLVGPNGPSLSFCLALSHCVL